MSKIMVTGVAVVDFIFKIKSMPKESEKYRAQEAYISGGGIAANAAVCISKLGGDATLVTRVGKDEIGEIIKKQLIADGVQVDKMKEYKDNRSSFSSVYIDKKGERQIVNYRDPLLPEDATWISDIEEHDVYLADTRWNQGAIETMKIAKKYNRPGILDAEDTVSAEAIKFASHVAFSSYGLKKFTQETNVKKALSYVCKITDGWVCVTNGDKGVFFLQDNVLKNIATPKVDVKETLGAGDVWHGAFALSLGEGKKESDAVRFANTVASLKCAGFGGRGSFPTRQETEEFLRGQEL